MTNATAQSLQGGRFLNYWYFGGRERKFAQGVPIAAQKVESKVLDAVEQAEAKAKTAVGK